MNRAKFKKRALPFFGLLNLVCFVIFGSIIYADFVLPDNFNVYKGNALKISGIVPISAKADTQTASGKIIGNDSEQSYMVNINAFGIIPVKQAQVSVIDDSSVCLLGTPFGIKIYTDGVMLVGIDDVDTDSGNRSPANEAGLKVGDLILSINGQKVYSNEEVAEIIEKSNGGELKFIIERNGSNLTLTLKPLISYSSGKYRAGIWVRDSSAGVGTLTFYSPALKVMCGLGHGICDIDTGELLTVNSGELVGAEILGIQKGASGNPGELKGRFTDSTYGKLIKNNEAGVYADCEMEEKNGSLIKIALKQEAEVGKAKIYCTVDQNSGSQLYDCEIKKIAYNNSVTKNMVIHITDSKLLEKTGGIVQGMSGSPIIQNGKMIGAVTHVLVDDPTTGFAIFAENMLNEAKTVSKKSEKSVS